MSNQTNQEILTTSNDYWVDLAEALVRLESNPDFKKVILEGYFRDKAVDGFHVGTPRSQKTKSTW
jgi:hypothetical protein